MFRGETTLNMDDKGRVAVPARHREALKTRSGNTLVLTISLLDRCLTAYLVADWQRIEDELKRLPALDRKAQGIRHLLIGHAVDCDLDGHGRMVVPQSLREFAGLGKRIKMVGQASKFELWDEAVWNERREALLAEVGDLLSEPSEALRSLVL
jgi:MraZ protein